MHPRHYGCPTRGTNRRAAEALFENRTLFGKSINIWSDIIFPHKYGEPPMVGSDGLAGVIIRKDEDDVWLGFGGS